MTESKPVIVSCALLIIAIDDDAKEIIAKDENKASCEVGESGTSKRYAKRQQGERMTKTNL